MPRRKFTIARRRVSMTWPEYQRGQCTIDGMRCKVGPAIAELLALLLISDPATFVGMDDILDALWPNPDRQPDTWRNVVSVYMAKLSGLGVQIERRVGRGMGQGCRSSDQGWRIAIIGRGGRLPAQRLAA
jgi:hypothetical protein